MHVTDEQDRREFVAAELASIADCPTRLEILRVLGRHSLSVGDLTRALSVSYQLVSNHLRALRAAGLVTSMRDGKLINYSLSPHCSVKDDEEGTTWRLRTPAGCELIIHVAASVLDPA